MNSWFIIISMDIYLLISRPYSSAKYFIGVSQNTCLFQLFDERMCVAKLPVKMNLL